MSRQTDAMNRQATISERQTDLSEEAARWRRDEAIGTFYRVAFDLVEEFKKANVAAPGTKIEANYQTYPRLMLREAARLFSPLGDLVTAMTEVAFFLEDYFSAVVDYNTSPRGVEGAGRWHRVQSAREKVGERLDNAESHIPPESRWEVAGEPDIRFAHRCAAPPAIAEAFGIETATPPPASRVDTPSGTRPASDDAPTT